MPSRPRAFPELILSSACAMSASSSVLILPTMRVFPLCLLCLALWWFLVIPKCALKSSVFLSGERRAMCIFRFTRRTVQKQTGELETSLAPFKEMGKTRVPPRTWRKPSNRDGKT